MCIVGDMSKAQDPTIENTYQAEADKVAEASHLPEADLVLHLLRCGYPSAVASKAARKQDTARAMGEAIASDFSKALKWTTVLDRLRSKVRR